MPEQDVWEIKVGNEVYEVKGGTEEEAAKAVQRMLSSGQTPDQIPAPAAVAEAPDKKQGRLLPGSYTEGDDDWEWDWDAGITGMAKSAARGIKDFAVDSAKKVKYFGERIRDTATGPGMDEVATTMDNGDMYDKDGNFLGNQMMLGQQDASSAQRVAELFTPTSPAMGTGKGIAAVANQRAGRVSGNQVTQAGARIGVQIPKAVASDDELTRFLGKKIAETPIVGGPLQEAGSRSLQQLDDAASAASRKFGIGVPPGATGSALRNDITHTAKKVLPDWVSKQYAEVDKLVTPNVVSPLTATKRVAGEILNDRLTSAKVGNSAALRTIEEAVKRPDGLTYQGIKGLRTQIGEMLDDPMRLTAAGIEQAELKRIYGALTDDLAASVKRASPDGKAYKVWQRANASAKTAAEARANLDKLLRVSSDEALVARLGQMASERGTANIQQLSRAKSAVSEHTWNELAAATLASMGRDASGNFTPDRFVTAWGRMSPSGKRLMFGGNKEAFKALEDIATVSTRFKEINQLANTSRTAASTNTMAIIAGMWAAPWATIGTLGGTYAYGRFLASPAAVKAMAAYGRAAQAAATPSATRAAVYGARKAMEPRAKVLAAVLLKEGVVNSDISVQDLAVRLMMGTTDAPATE